ncbi:MAG TPA: TetR/AcrR family transcriptional regulator [Stellaceae bacterium]|nr:TetR/AcrR family transcriptional regulator [Stellaceae bacterium]
MTETEVRAAPRRGGRPTREDAAQLGERIIAVATGQFLGHGFGATSIEGVAIAAGISKRTFYHRFRDKPGLFRAVVRRLIAQWSTPFEAQLLEPAPLEATLTRVAKQVLAAALSPEALALYRLLLAEAPRFPELAKIIAEQSTAGGNRLAQLLAREARAGTLAIEDAEFAAAQFVNMVIAAPRRNALGLGPAMNAAELERWTRRTVALFLDGCRARGA